MGAKTWYPTGPLIAGVIGERKFAYDVGRYSGTPQVVWSQVAHRGESTATRPMKLWKDYFECEYRGKSLPRIKVWLRCIT